MTDNKHVTNTVPNSQSVVMRELGKGTRLVNRIFKCIFSVLFVLTISILVYWFVASDRYVSEAVVLVQNTETGGTTDASDLLNMFNSNNGNKADQLLLVNYLSSLDMLNKADANLDLRTHYSSKEHDIFSRLWDRDISIEWFYRYFLRRVDVVYDEYNGVVKISVQAFDPETSYKLASFMVKEGELFMNELSHVIAKEQVSFLEKQVEESKDEMVKASQKLLSFQNQKNITSPTAEVNSYQSLIADLEKQKSELLIKISTLPSSLGTNNSIKISLNSQVEAIEKQIEQLRNKLTSNDKTSLNDLVDKEQQLKMDVDFKKDIYSSALTGLVKGRMNAARLIKHVSILQKPSVPEYAMKPDRIYDFLATIFVSLLVFGMLHLLKAVILDHVD